MIKNGFLSEEEGESAKSEKIQFAEDVKPAYIHGYFMDLALEEAAALLDIKQEELYTGGYRIFTTMNNDIQEYAEQLYSQEDLFPKSPVSGNTCESALVIMDTKTGAASGNRWEILSEGQRYVLNRADVRRLPISYQTLGCLCSAVEMGNITPVSFIDDEPVSSEIIHPVTTAEDYME